jgi:hypothetical protein
MGTLGGSPLDTQIVQRILLDNGNQQRSVGTRGGYSTGQATLGELFKSLVVFCPPEHQPQAVEFFTSAEAERDIQLTRTVENGLSFLIFAPTAEQARQRATGILRLHDAAVSRPLQQFLLAESRKHLAEARAKCDEHDRLLAELVAEREKLKEPSEVSTDILTELKAQRIMVTIELAGLSARVKACDQMLIPPRQGETKRLEAGALQAISDIKVKAEIERIGTQEKLDRINAFIAEGDRRRAIQSNIATLTNRRDRALEAARASLQDAEAHATRIDLYAPRALENNTITISPVEWTE